MQIKLGVEHIARELSIDSTLSADEIQQAFNQAKESGTLLELTDEQGRKLLVPADKVSYLDLGPANARHVGFGAV